MPEGRRTSSVRSFFSNLHFSGKVIMASVLFGFGLLLVGAILLVITTGQQKVSPLRENVDEQQQKTPMTFVGPGVMGVGAFFVIVGTIMCLFETRVLRRRRHTDRDSLINSEIVTTGNAADKVHQEEGDKNLMKGEETEVKTVHEDHHTEVSVGKEENFPVESDSLEKCESNEFSTSVEREKVASFNTSVYVDALEENDEEEQFITESTQYSTPPESEPHDVQKASFNGEHSVERDHLESLDLEAIGTGVTTQPTKEGPMSVSEINGNVLPLPKEKDSSLPITEEKDSSLLVPKQHKSSLPESKEDAMALPIPKDDAMAFPIPKEDAMALPTPKEDAMALPIPKADAMALPISKEESSLPVPEEKESSLPLPNDSESSEIHVHTEETLQDIHSSESSATEVQNVSIAYEERQEDSAQAGPVSELLDAGVKDSVGTDSEKVEYVETTDPNNT